MDYVTTRQEQLARCAAVSYRIVLIERENVGIDDVKNFLYFATLCGTTSS